MRVDQFLLERAAGWSLAEASPPDLILYFGAREVIRGGIPSSDARGDRARLGAQRSSSIADTCCSTATMSASRNAAAQLAIPRPSIARSTSRAAE